MNVKHNFVLRLSGREESNDDLVKQTANLYALLAGQDGIEVVGRPLEVRGLDGTEQKSDPSSLTAVALAFLTGGVGTLLVASFRDVLVKLIDAIGASHPNAKTSYVEYELEDEHGQKYKFKGNQLSQATVERTLESAERFFNDGLQLKGQGSTAPTGGAEQSTPEPPTKV